MKIIKPYFVIEDAIDSLQILKKIEKAGRTCYKSEDKITDKSCINFVKKIITSGHYSVLEHEKVTVRVICDRGVTHEIVRHRIASYSQESTRYCNYGKDSNGVTFILPMWFYKYLDPCLEEKEYNYTNYLYNTVQNIKNKGEFTSDNLNFIAWYQLIGNCESTYLDLLARGQSPQQARSVLPNSLKTEIVMTMNLREWRHFFTLRTAPAAHPQMREISISMLEEFKKLIPIIFDD